MSSTKKIPAPLRTLKHGDMGNFPTLYIGDRITTACGGWVQIEELRIKIGMKSTVRVDFFWLDGLDGDTGRGTTDFETFLHTYCEVDA